MTASNRNHLAFRKGMHPSSVGGMFLSNVIRRPAAEATITPAYGNVSVSMEHSVCSSQEPGAASVLSV